MNKNIYYKNSYYQPVMATWLKKFTAKNKTAVICINTFFGRCHSVYIDVTLGGQKFSFKIFSNYHLIWNNPNRVLVLSRVLTHNETARFVICNTAFNCELQKKIVSLWNGLQGISKTRAQQRFKKCELNNPMFFFSIIFFSIRPVHDMVCLLKRVDLWLWFIHWYLKLSYILVGGWRIVTK